MQPKPGQPPAADLDSIPQPEPRHRSRGLGWLARGLTVVAVVAIVALWLRMRSFPPAVVRMLPPGETLLYLNLAPLHAAGWAGGGLVPAALPAAAAPGYAAFVAGSGFDFTRDLQALACSLQGAPRHPATTTCELAGQFGPQLPAWLAAHAQRRLALAPGETAYQFPGWAQPDRPLYVYLPDRSHLVATNADPAALARRAPRTPPLWQGSFWAAPPIGYLAVDTEALAASRELDGTTPPWRGAESLVARLSASPAGLTLTAVERTTNATDARAASAWTGQQIAALDAMLPPGAAGRLSLHDLLDRLQVRPAGNQLTLTLPLPAALLATLTQPVQH